MALLATVVVVTWNRADLLRRCLPALLAQELDGADTFDVVVVDNASSDDTLGLLARDFPAVRVVHNEENLGFAGGNNVALEQVTAPYAVLLNNDAVPEPGWLRALLAPFARPGGETLGATGSKILFQTEWLALRLNTPRFEPPNDDARLLGIRLVSATVNGLDVLSEVRGAVHEVEDGFRWTSPRGRVYVPRPGPGPWTVELGFATGADRAPSWVRVGWPGGRQRLPVAHPEVTRMTIALTDRDAPARFVNSTGGVLLENGQGADRDWFRPDDGSCDEPAELFFGCGNGLAVRTSAGREVGWFDDAYFLYYEDVDLSWRLRARGWQVRYVPDAVILHEHNATTGDHPELTTFLVERNRLLTLTANASRPFLGRELAAFVRNSVAVVSDRSRPRAERRLRWRVVGSYLRLLPHAVARRRAFARTATVSRRRLERLVTPLARWQEHGH